MTLSKRLDFFAESKTLKMAKLSRELSAKGVDVINLTLGEPDFATPSHIINAAKKAMDDGFTKYPPVAGYLDLKQAICQKFKTDNNLDYTPDQIVVSTGAKQSIMNVILSVVNPGDEVVIPTPYWVSYSEMVKFAEGIPVLVDATVEQNYKVSAAQIEAAITPKTKLFMFSSPCNPSGSIWSKQELSELAEVLNKYPEIYIISDEIYEHINFIGKHESIAQFDYLKERVIIINGVSKGFAMTGWRLGYIGASKEIAQACEKIQGQFTSGANSIAQRATLAALTTDLKPTYDMQAAYHRRRDLIVNLSKEIKGFTYNVPDGAFYLFPDVRSYFGKSDGNTKIENADDLCMYLLDNAHVSLVSGDAFGTDTCIRISFATADEKLIEAFARMKIALDKLQ
jgi:aspartate aminotransferase